MAKKKRKVPASVSDGRRSPKQSKWTKRSYLKDAPSSELREKLLVAMPSGFDPKTHAPLRTTDFADEADYYEWKCLRKKDESVRIMAQAVMAEQKANELRALGAPEVREKIREAQALERKAARLRESARNGQ